MPEQKKKLSLEDRIVKLLNSSLEQIEKTHNLMYDEKFLDSATHADYLKLDKRAINMNNNFVKRIINLAGKIKPTKKMSNLLRNYGREMTRFKIELQNRIDPNELMPYMKLIEDPKTGLLLERYVYPAPPEKGGKLGISKTPEAIMVPPPAPPKPLIKPKEEPMMQSMDITQKKGAETPEEKRERLRKAFTVKTEIK